MPNIKIDGQEIAVPEHYTLMQACEHAGAEIPRFCYHERLSVAGNCRMCLVEVKGGPPKPTASCAMSVRDLRPGPNGEAPEVFTNTPMVKKAREGVMEFLLINHPLDCPICDQAGECDLQDQAMSYGVDSSRFKENKRAVEDKYIGPLVKTVMTRCIHCTRCVRFTTEVAGISELGLVGRGEDAEITTYLERAMTSELQGNVIDLCPVGALTSRPYAFTARPWELNKTESVDVMDAVGSNIRIDSRGREVMRIMPRINELVNEEWISDKTRFVWDGLKSQRLDRPYVRKSGKLQPASWDTALAAVARAVRKGTPDRIAAIAGDLAGVEEMYALKGIMDALGARSLDCRPSGSVLDRDKGRASYIFNPGIAGIDHADAILIIGSNPRKEAAILNARIRKASRTSDVPIGVIGENADLGYDYEYLGAGTNTLVEVASGAGAFARTLQSAKRPMVVVGEGVLVGRSGRDVLALAATIARNSGALSPGWNGFAVLHRAAALVGGLDVGFVPARGGRDRAGIDAAAAAGELDIVFLLGADDIDEKAYKDTFVVYIGSHGDVGVHSANVILPGVAYTEKSATYVNTAGFVQQTNRAVFGPGEAREDWAILRALSARLDCTLPFDNLRQLRDALYADHPHFAALDCVANEDAKLVEKLAKLPARPQATGLSSTVGNFYLTNPIARASAVMAACAQQACGDKREAAG